MGEITQSEPSAPARIRLANELPFLLGELRVYPATRQVEIGGRKGTLEPRVMQVLVALARAEGSVVSRDELIETCWNGRIVGEDAIHRVLFRLRGVASGIGGGNFSIETIRGVGYRLSVGKGLHGDAPSPMPFDQIQFADPKSRHGAQAHAGWMRLWISDLLLNSGEDERRPEQTGTKSRALIEIRRWWIAVAFAFVIAAGAYFYGFVPTSNHSKPIVAVLPFRSLDAQDETLVAGIWEDTRTSIGRNPQLIVLGPNSAEALAGKSANAVKRAADYLVEASIRTAGDKIRVSADLVRTRDGAQLWSQDFDSKLDDVFALQSQIAGQIEGHIRGRLAQRGGVAPEHIATSGEAYALYADARAKIRKGGSGEDYTAARRELEQVVKLDPNYAPAWASLAVVVEEIPTSQDNWQVAIPAETYARKAIELAPNLGVAHAALCLALNGRGPVARAEIERAIKLDPSDYEALDWAAGMRDEAGEKAAALDAYRRAVAIEPFFWPAVLNLYWTLKKAGDQQGIQELLEQERRVGADYLATTIKIDAAFQRGALGEAANLGLTYWKTGRKEGRPAIGGYLWRILIMLGFIDEAYPLGPAPKFAPLLWRLDPKGLDLMESQHIDARSFFRLSPLTENAGRLYLLTGRGKKFADEYLSLKMTPEEYASMAETPDHFLYVVPLLGIALRANGHNEDASALLSFAEKRARERLRDGSPASSIFLARIYAVEGHKNDAAHLLTAAASRGWLPIGPELLSDLASDPAWATLKNDPRFEAVRERILATIRRQRAQVNPALLRQLTAA